VPVSLLARFEFGVVAGLAVDAKDFTQFVAWLKANPGKATYGVPSNGTIPHFTGSRLEEVVGISMTRVPYRGSAPIINDLVGGHLPFGITTIADAIPQHRAGGVKILAVSSAARSPFLSDVPTLKEKRYRSGCRCLVRDVATSGEFTGVCQSVECGRDRSAGQTGSAREASGNRPDSGWINPG
jgi:tripartite-type tricarboxylate transporter receptor subunit TctC